MKKLLLFATFAGLSFGSFAQSVNNNRFSAASVTQNSASAGKVTSPVYHDTLALANTASTDTGYLYYGFTHHDSGYVLGTSALGFSGFAERFDINPVDSNVEVIGIAGWFGGHISATSTKTITYKIWSQGPVLVGRPTLAFNGFPGTILDSIVVPITALGISATGGDTVKAKYFTTPTAYLNDSFFAGYTMNYNYAAMGGDTLTMLANGIGHRTAPVMFVSAGDSMINVKNCVFDTSIWLDNGFNLGFKVDYFVFPIVKVRVTEGFQGITKAGLTFYGNYPNPANTCTNIKFSLANTDDVIIRVTNVSGQVVKTVTNNNMEAGVHTISLETNELPAGEYVYYIQAMHNGGFGSKFTVIR